MSKRRLTRQQKDHRRKIRDSRDAAKERQEKQQLERQAKTLYDYDGMGHLFLSLELRNEEFA
jgi:hypothetical protein